MRPFVSTKNLCGSDVFSRRGNSVGRIEGFVIDLENNRVSYTVISRADVQGRDDKLLVVPAKALRLDPNRQHLVLEVRNETFGDAPGFDRNHWPDFAESSFGLHVYSFYGVK